jgi:hypothetical protein
VVCATPHDASGHTPDRCYPGAGFEIAETEHRMTVPLADERTAEVFTGTFRKSGQTLRVFWTYGVDGRWIAPQIARIELAAAKAVYKLYVIIDETPLPPGVGSKVCVDFMGATLANFDAALREQTQPANAPCKRLARVYRRQSCPQRTSREHKGWIPHVLKSPTRTGYRHHRAGRLLSGRTAA